MNINNLLIYANELLDSANVAEGAGFRDNAIFQLSELRKFLNSQPELKANGTTGHCRGCGCTEASACPEGCYWVEPDLCSVCARKFCHLIKKRD